MRKSRTPAGPVIRAVSPSAGAPGGEVVIECVGFAPALPERGKVLLGDAEASILSASAEKVVVRLPNSTNALGIVLHTPGAQSASFPFSLAVPIAGGLHPVTSPAVTPEGDVITTISGTRGEQTPEPIVRITASGEKIAYPVLITNPTGLAFGPDGELYISSRHEGMVVRYTGFNAVDVVAQDLGIACGIAFDSRGFLYVGDRGGKIYQLDDSGTKREFAALEPSVSAYHLAVDEHDSLYVTGPTLSMRDALYRISSGGRVERVLEGLARPQGMALLGDGDLLLTASYRGRKGVFRYAPATGEIHHFIAAPTLVGIARRGDVIYLADRSSVASIRLDTARTSVV